MPEREQLGKYGENPHQTAWLVRDEGYEGPTVINQQLHGKPLGKNNLDDANAALEVLLDFADRDPTVVVIKHQNPCGLATGKTLREAFFNAWKGDEVSAFGSIVGFNRPVDAATAQSLEGKFVEVAVAPVWEDAALDWIRANPKKEGMRVIPTGPLTSTPYEFQRSVRGGMIIQTSDNLLCLQPERKPGDPKLVHEYDPLFKVPTTVKGPDGKDYTVGTVTKGQFPDSPENEQRMGGLIEFGLIASKHVKSNEIVIAYEYREGHYRLLGIGAGQPNRLDSVRKLAVPKARENLMRHYFREQGLDYAMTMDRIIHDPHYATTMQANLAAYEADILRSRKVVLISGAFFPQRDGLDAVGEAGIKYVIQPGGSKKDSDVIKAADDHGIAMAFTGVRHFKH